MENRCSGCSACAIICPVGCINMKLNYKGFLRPYIDKEKCIKCNLCKRICIFNQKEDGRGLDTAELYAAWSKNKEVRITTTSGGIGYEIAKYAIQKNYYVCGVEFLYDEMKAQHCICKNYEDIEKIKGSKYLQSDCKHAIRELVQILKNDSSKKTIFFGTPCQVAGMHNILVKNNLRDQVVLIDIFCHGVPTFYLWNKYLKWLENRKKIKANEIKQINFRDKKYSWHTYYMHITYEENKEYICNRKKDPFLKLFSMGVLNQKECFSCQYRNSSFADIRLGDFWGERFQNSEKGYSMVLVLSQKGKDIINNLEEIQKEEIPIKERLGQQHTDYILPDGYDRGFEMLNKDHDNLKKIINYYDPISKRVIRECKEQIKKLLRR